MQATWHAADSVPPPDIEDALNAVKDVRIVMMNPPFHQSWQAGREISQSHAAKAAAAY